MGCVTGSVRPYVWRKPNPVVYKYVLHLWK
jgi:hypothetical protein